MAAKLHPEASNFDLLKVALADSQLSVEDQRLLLAGSWTLEQLPAITSARQCKAYRKSADRLARQHWDGSDDRFEAFVRSREGMQSTALDARIIEWEERE